MSSRREHFAIALVAAALALVLAGVFYKRGVKVGSVEVPPEPGKSRSETAEYGELEKEPEVVDEIVSGARWFLAESLLEKHLRDIDVPYADWSFQLYIPDKAQTHMLIPILKPGHNGESPLFQIGQGVTGQAWLRNDYVAVSGSAVWDGTYGLTTEQQVRYRDRKAVAALPITNGSGTPIAVLSASTEVENSLLMTDEGLSHHALLGELLARILIDLLKWFDD